MLNNCNYSISHDKNLWFLRKIVHTKRPVYKLPSLLADFCPLVPVRIILNDINSLIDSSVPKRELAIVVMSPPSRRPGGSECLASQSISESRKGLSSEFKQLILQRIDEIGTSGSKPVQAAPK